MMEPTDGTISRSDMPKRLQELLQEKELELGRSCRKLWTFTNPNRVRFIFGDFGQERTKETLARHADEEGWIWEGS